MCYKVDFLFLGEKVVKCDKSIMIIMRTLVEVIRRQ